MNVYGKWSFVLTLVSAVFLTVFAVFLLTGYAIALPSWITNAIGSIALLVLFTSVGLSLASIGKGEPGKWKFAPWTLIAASTIILIVMLNIVWL
jgi:hypothetical protein